VLKHIGHLVAYDLRALRLPLVVWGLVLAVQAVLLLIGPANMGIDPRLSRGIAYDYGVLVVRLALTAILVALVVQRDALVGTTVFWRTRPIPRHRLFASKICAAFLLVVLVPWLLMFGVLVGLGVPLAAAARGATSVATEQALVATFALAAAVLTANLAHFVIAAFASLTLVMALGAVLPVLSIRGSYVTVRWTSEVFTITALVGAVVVVAHQYLTLRTRRSAALMAVALALATVGGAMWRPVRVEATAGPVDPSLLRAETVVVRLEELGWSSHRPIRNRVLEQEWVLAGVLRPSGEPDGILLMPDAVDVSLSYAGGTVVDQRFDISGGGGQSTTRATSRDQPYRSVWAALGDVDLVLRPNSAEMRSLVGLATVPDDVARGLAGSNGIIDATVRLRAFRYVVTARTGVSDAAAAARVQSVIDYLTRSPE